MTRDQYINEVRRKSLLCVFKQQRRIVAHPKNRTSGDYYPVELRWAGCAALDYAAAGRAPAMIANARGVHGFNNVQHRQRKWEHDVHAAATDMWQLQRPADCDSAYWWSERLDRNAVQHRLRAIDNIIKDLTPAAVSRNKREGKFVGHIRFARIFGRKRMVTPAIRCHDGLYVTK